MVINAEKPNEVDVIVDNNLWAFKDNTCKLIDTENEDEDIG